MKVSPIHIPGILVVEPHIFGDERGTFSQTFDKDTFNIDFIIEAQSISRAGVIRGLHFQEEPFAQSKLVRVSSGKIIDVVVDLRNGSPTYGDHFKIELSSKNGRQLFIPKGFAHGFLALTDLAVVQYKFDVPYNANAQAGIVWNDPDIGIDWGITKPIISDKDKNLPFWRYI